MPVIPGASSDEWPLLLVNRRVTNLYYYFYYVETFILTPDLQTRLNGEDDHFDQINYSAPGYRAMLQRSLDRYHTSSRP